MSKLIWVGEITLHMEFYDSRVRIVEITGGHLVYEVQRTDSMSNQYWHPIENNANKVKVLEAALLEVLKNPATDND